MLCSEPLLKGQLLVTGVFRKNEKHIGGYVLEIPIATWNVLRSVVANLVLNFMSKFTTFVG